MDQDVADDAADQSFNRNGALPARWSREERQQRRKETPAATGIRESWRSGETTLRERNQRAPSIAGNTGSRNAPMPKPWNIRSEIIAPTTPIQLRAARVEVSTEALFSDGSSGE